MRRSLLIYFALTYAVSWTLWAGAAAVAGIASPASGAAGLGALLFLPGTVAPALVAILLTARAEGQEGVQALLHRMFVTAPARWCVFAVLYMVGVELVVALLHRLATGSWPLFGDTPVYLIVFAIAVSTPIQAGEEIGWRGYALPRLTKLLGLPGASIVLGIVWACWHLPLFFVPGSDNSRESFPVYVLAVTAISVAMAWLYWKTQGSLFLTMLMHAAINNTAGIVQSPASEGGNPWTFRPPLTAWLTAAVLWAGAAYFLVRMRGKTLDAWRGESVSPTIGAHST